MHLDHIIITVPELDEAIINIAKELGCTPQYGGRHPGQGTCNAILGISSSYGYKQYVEFLAKDPEVLCKPNILPFDLGAGKTSPRVVAWAICCENIQEATKKLQRLELMSSASTIHAVRRQLPDSKAITCKVAYDPGQIMARQNALPFLIEWGGQGHALDSLNGENYCDNCLLEISHPDGKIIAERLRLLGLEDIAVRSSDEVGLSVRLAKDNHYYVFN